MKCPICGRTEQIKSCMIFEEDWKKNEISYSCELCGNHWTSTDIQKEETSKPSDECYWCSNYKDFYADSNQESPFILGVRPAAGGSLCFVNPTYCPFCGKAINQGE